MSSVLRNSVDFGPWEGILFFPVSRSQFSSYNIVFLWLSILAYVFVSCAIFLLVLLPLSWIVDKLYGVLIR